MSPAEEQALIENVKSLTDHMKMVDEVFKAARMGRVMTLAFSCGHSGLLYPGNYVKDWGKKFGIGLGPHPVSEVLDSEYDVDPPTITNATRNLSQIMHPMRVCCAQVDYDLVDVEALRENAAILDSEDPYMEERSKILRMNQLNNPRGRLQLMEVAWRQAGRKVQ